MMLPKTASEAMEEDEGENFLRNARFWVYMALFLVCLLNVFHVIDYPVVLITTLIIAAAMLICSFMVDVLNALLDPRVRLGE